MASNSKSGFTKEEREDFLRQHGFVPLRQGKGDHEVWEHPELKALAQQQKIACPANLLSNPAQPAWQHTIPDNPATGTWHRAVKHAVWCEETAEKLSGAVAERDSHRKLKEEFRKAQKEICAWKHETKHRLKAGLDANPAPASYHRMNEPKPA